MKNKINKTRLVTFNTDYSSTAGIETAARKSKELKKEIKPEVIYKGGSTHAIHVNVVAGLKEKGADMDVKMYNPAPYIAAAKKALAERMAKQPGY